MARISVEVPAELVGRVRETVVHMHAAAGESLGRALRGDAAGAEEVLRRRARLAALDRLLGALGPPAGTAGGCAGGLTVSAEPDLLHDALYGSLIDAGERLAAVSERCWRGELPLDRVEAAAGEVLAVVELLRPLGVPA